MNIKIKAFYYYYYFYSFFPYICPLASFLGGLLWVIFYTVFGCLLINSYTQTHLYISPPQDLRQAPISDYYQVITLAASLRQAAAIAAKHYLVRQLEQKLVSKMSLHCMQCYYEHS
jgi:hypothetical protein